MYADLKSALRACTRITGRERVPWVVIFEPKLRKMPYRCRSAIAAQECHQKIIAVFLPNGWRAADRDRIIAGVFGQPGSGTDYSI